ncbi:MAG: 4Fe-4S dicluster domain-containing protein, partial [Desulfatitalea sp.]|nr:4Fe-4S dicluster domain-containing protein [Desulfatitalea sp.]
GKGDWPGMSAAVLGQQKILARPLVGLAHLCLVWGFILYILIVIAAQTPLSLPSTGATLISLGLDTVGGVMLAATIFFLIRRIIRLRKGLDLVPPKQTLLPSGLLLVVLISGFFAEASRLNILDTQPFWAAPVGRLFSVMAPAAPLFMQVMIRVHFVFVILFLTTLPFTFMRHVGAVTIHLLYKEKSPVHLPRPLSLTAGPLGAATVADLGPAQRREAEACVSCGRCDEHCPALISGKPLSPRMIMGKIADQAAAWPHGEGNSLRLPRLDDTIGDDEIWACTTCMACVSHCPVSIRPMDKILEMRRSRVLNQGALPTEALTTIRNLELFGDIYGKGPAHKSDWSMNYEVPHINELSAPPEVLLWVGCSAAFHPEYQETARCLVKILRAGQMSFAVLGHEALCCGDPARKLGDEALFLDLARKNIQRLQSHDVQHIVTLCPHCRNTLAQDYAQLGFQVEVRHAAQLVSRLIDQGRIQLKYPYPKSVAVHDPCYLGRYGGIYAPVRRIAGTVQGTTVKEAPRNGGNGFCCGGGGGRMWLHETLGERMNHLRARELMDTNADTIVTACPYCLTLIADGVGAMKAKKKPQVIDIVKLAADALA